MSDPSPRDFAAPLVLAFALGDRRPHVVDCVASDIREAIDNPRFDLIERWRLRGSRTHAKRHRDELIRQAAGYVEIDADAVLPGRPQTIESKTVRAVLRVIKDSQESRWPAWQKAGGAPENAPTADRLLYEAWRIEGKLPASPQGLTPIIQR